MSYDEPAEMDSEERDEFLGNGGTGVMSFSTEPDTPPHSIPVSYGYDATEANFYFRLAVGPESGKGDPTERTVSIVIYDETDDTWRSVVASGQLEATDEKAIATETLAGFERVQIPIVDIFGRPSKDVPFKFYRLVPDEITTRKESSTSL